MLAVQPSLLDEAWERSIAEVWATAGDRSDDDVIAAITALAADRSDGAALYERASAYDYAGQEALAEPLYRAALDAGLDTDRRPRAVIQLASTLRNLGRPQESAELLLADAEAPDDLGDARTAFLSLALMDAGRPAEALRYALNALAAHLPQYQRAVRAYADDLASDVGHSKAG
jgi:tetratricopeptide (TPR) repeat protein